MREHLCAPDEPQSVAGSATELLGHLVGMKPLGLRKGWEGATNTAGAAMSGDEDG